MADLAGDGAEAVTIRMQHFNINTNGGLAKMPTENQKTFVETMDAATSGLRETDQERFARTNLSSLEITDQESKAVQKTNNRVSLGSMVAKIENVEYIRPINLRHMTICVITMQNGWALVGKSAPADAENYNLELGQKFAYEDALRQCWQLEGYLLREQLYRSTEGEDHADIHRS